MSLPEITVVELNARHAAGSVPFLLDVREPHELEICQLDGVVNVPLATLPQALETLPKEAEIVAICHHGARSARAVAFLQSNGFTGATNLVGGMHAWAQEIDPSMATY